MDYHAALVDPETGLMRQEYTNDGIHPQSEGFAVMAETLRRALLSRGLDI